MQLSFQGETETYMPTQCPVTQALHGWYQAVTRQRPSCEDEGRERLEDAILAEAEKLSGYAEDE